MDIAFSESSFIETYTEILQFWNSCTAERLISDLMGGWGNYFHICLDVDAGRSWIYLEPSQIYEHHNFMGGEVRVIFPGYIRFDLGNSPWRAGCVHHVAGGVDCDKDGFTLEVLIINGKLSGLVCDCKVEIAEVPHVRSINGDIISKLDGSHSCNFWFEPHITVRARRLLLITQ